MIETRGRVKFFDGMRVSRDHLDHLQDLFLSAAMQGRGAAGAGVVFGLEVIAGVGEKVMVRPGLAYDQQQRPLSLTNQQEIDLTSTSVSPVFLAIKHKVSASGIVNGISTIISDGAEIIVKESAPPFNDGAIIFARLEKQGDGVLVEQLGKWFLPPLMHTHSGEFYHDAAGNLRYDGDEVVAKGNSFDSGFISVGAGDEIRIAHGLSTSNLLVQVQCRKGEDGPISSEGLGTIFWYELTGTDEVVLKNGGSQDLLLRAQLWPLDTDTAGPVPPLAHAGHDAVVELGRSFSLDGSNSKAFSGRRLVKYIWTRLS